ncbi:MAG TPA: NAD-dependent epimerase/dehydratase family protein [Chitinophagaceae bacterium]
MRKILITGGAGNIAGSLACKLVEDPETFVVVVDNLTTGSVKKLPPPSDNFKFIKADVNHFRDISPIMTAYQFDYVFHYAAMVGVQRTLDNPIKVLEDIDGIKNILDLAKNTGVKRVFYSSSSEVYGEPVSLPQHEETTPLNSRLPYAVVKNVGEAFFRSYQQEFGLDFTIFRFFNTYGPRQSDDFVLPKFLHAALSGRDIPIYGNGSQTRTFCYVDDNIEATMRTLDKDWCINETINVGNDHEVTILQLANLIIDLTNSKSKVIHLAPLKEGDMTRRQPDISKMKAILGRPLTTLEEGIQKMLQTSGIGPGSKSGGKMTSVIR